MKPKVLHVATAHFPLDTRIFRKEILSLVRHGYDVGWATTVARSQSLDQVPFIPLGEYGGSRWRRIPRNLRALRAMLASRASLIHFHDAELLITVIPALLAGKKIIYDIHEFYYERIRESLWIWKGGRLLAAKFYEALERLLIPHFVGIVVVTERMEKMYRERFPRARIALVRNYPLLSQEDRAAILSKGSPLDAPYIVQVGGAHRLKAFDVIVAAAEILRWRGVSAPIVIIGPINLEDYSPGERTDLLARSKVADVRLLGIMEHPEMMRWIAYAKVGYLVRTDVDNSRFALPTKLFEYFAMGIPVVATAVGLMEDLVKENNAGLAVTAGDPEAHAAALEKLLTDDAFSKRAAAASRQAGHRYSFATELEPLLNLYSQCSS